jgi:hypothetical protein
MTSNDANKVLNEGLESSRRQSQGSSLECGLGLSSRSSSLNDLDCGRAWLREAFRCARRRKTDCVSGIGKGNTRVCGEFIVVTLSPLSEIAVMLVGA